MSRSFWNIIGTTEHWILENILLEAGLQDACALLKDLTYCMERKERKIFTFNSFELIADGSSGQAILSCDYMPEEPDGSEKIDLDILISEIRRLIDLCKQ